MSKVKNLTVNIIIIFLMIALFLSCDNSGGNQDSLTVDNISYSLTINITDGGGFTATVDGVELTGSSPYTVQINKTVELTAFADANYTFLGWGGDISGGEDTKNVIMNGDKTVSLSFCQSETIVDNSIADAQSSSTDIITDSNYKVHISYTDYSANSLKYTTNKSGTWVISSIDITGKPDSTSIAVDSLDYIHISYNDRDNGILKYATNTSGEWVIASIDSGIGSYSFTSIAVDSLDKIHVSYYDSTNGDLKYATNETGSWVPIIIDSTYDVGQYASIGIDSNNKIHICYFIETEDPDRVTALKYATNASGSWVCTTIVENAEHDVGERCSLVVDSNDYIHISYNYAYGEYSSDLLHVTNSTGSWVQTTIDSSGGSYDTSIAIDNNGKIHIGYQYQFDGNPTVFKHATNVSGSWIYETIDPSDYAGWCPSLTVDNNNNIHMCCVDGTNCSLKYYVK